MRVGGSKFVRGTGAAFFVEANGSVTGVVTLRDEYGGPPGYIHGGVLAALIDEAMGAAAWHAGHRSFAAHLDFDYRQPVPPGVEVRVSARVDRIEGRKAFTSGVLTLPDGTVAVEGKGLFVEVKNLPADTEFQFGETKA
jgi:acyl-coenzyme A thioesterase PaaI-like protein